MDAGKSGVTVTTKQSGYVKIAGGVLAILVSILTVVGYANKGVDERIDSKIITHEAVFEAKQQETIGAIRQNVAVLDEKVGDIKEDTKEIKDLLKEIANK